MISGFSVISMQSSYREYAGLEHAAWHLTGDVRPVFANRKDTTARRDEIEMG
jgi:hypothetical protein